MILASAIARIALGAYPRARLRRSPLAAVSGTPEPERLGSRQPPALRFAVQSGEDPRDQSPRSPQESPRLRTRCIVRERKSHGETTDGWAVPPESAAPALLPGV